MNVGSRYVKIVEWSEEDQCFVGSCPGLFYGGCHGDDEQRVFAELCQLVDETVKLYQDEGRPLPPPTSGKDFANSLQTRGRYLGNLRWHQQSTAENSNVNRER